MTESTTPRYRFWGSHKPIADQLRVEMATAGDQPAQMKIYGPVDDWGQPFGVSADEFGQALAQLGDAKAIDLHIHSPGGIAFEGVAIMNQLRQHPATVNVIVDGLCASAASVIAMGADRVTMVPGSQMMIHDASGLCLGNAVDMETMRARLDSLSQNIADQYAAKAGGTADDWRASMQPESWYTAQEAVDAGLADDVLKASSKSAEPTDRFDLSIFAHAGREQAPAPAMPTATVVGSHSTATDTGAWDGATNEKRLPSPMPLATAKKAYAWYDGGKVEGGEVAKAACKFPHHLVSSDGTPGAASTKACQAGIAVLNGGRGGASIPDADRQGVYNHLAKHLRDADLTPAPLNTTQTPAEPPETQHPDTQEVVTMTPEEIKALRERLGLAEDADASAINAKLDELEEQATNPDPEKPAVTPEPDATAVAAALAKDGKVAVSQTFLDEIKSQAAEGVKARKRQLDEDRDDAIRAAVAAGKISRDRAGHWSAYWDKDPEGAKAELDQLEARFPVGAPLGHQDGGENADVDVMTDEQASALASTFGVPKEALING